MTYMNIIVAIKGVGGREMRSWDVDGVFLGVLPFSPIYLN